MKVREHQKHGFLVAQARGLLTSFIEGLTGFSWSLKPRDEKVIKIILFWDSQLCAHARLAYCSLRPRN